MYIIDYHIEQYRDKGDDSGFVEVVDNKVLICVADGAGGISGGFEAGQFALAESKKFLLATDCDSPDEYEEFIRKLDTELYSNSSCGETTVILGKIDNGLVNGGSVGDSQCWLYSKVFDYELTSLQNRKPLVGSGASVPIGFGPMELMSSMVIGTDGLFDFAEHSAIREMALSAGENKARNMVSLAKNASDKLNDDTTAIIVVKS